MAAGRGDRRRWAWSLVAVVVGSWLLAVLLVALGVAPRAGPGTAGAVGGDDPGVVVVVGVPGLTWDLVSAGTTPTIDRLAREGAAGALVLRGTHEVTCAADAWLTLGAGQRAATDVEGCVDAAFEGTPDDDRPAPSLVEDLVAPSGDGAVLEQDRWDGWRASAARRALGPELGTLSSTLEGAGTCAAAHGPLAALGAADAQGRVTAYLDGGWPLPATLDPACRVHLLSTPEAGPRLAELDTALGRLTDGLPDGATLVLAGMGHTAQRAEAQVVVVHPVDGNGNGDGGAALSSGTTRQRGLVQLTDLTATVLRLAGTEPPEPVAGAPVTVSPSTDPVAGARDLAGGISGAKRLTPWVLGALAAAVLPLLGVAVGIWWRGRGAAPASTAGGSVWAGRAVAGLATFGMAVPAATFLAGLVPWWGFARPGVLLTVVVAVGALLVAGIAWAGPWRRDPLAPPAVVAAVTLAVLGADVVCSSRLGLVSVLGLQPVTAGRFYGQGNVGFGIVLGGFLVLAGVVVSWLRGREAAAAVVLLGAATTAVNAAPQAGADFGGVPALVVATGMVALAALGVRWSLPVVAGLAAVAVVVAAGVMVADWARGPARRTHLGDFVQSALDGEALGIVSRKLSQSVGILVSYPVSWLAVLALAAVAVVVWRRPTWSAALWEQPGLRPTAVAALVGCVLVWALNDSGIAAVALTLTMLIGSALTVLGRQPPGASGRG
ncbi:hypothetical protein ACI3ET_05225 [Ornithinimicrobium sp. LYQ121]|uniref:hypothetical protein n=1 Tax=Ornithinimicrobium sp. LYQ121 TaxID=3378801 RepID=UPI003852A9D2